MKEDKLISVIMGIYNCADTLKAAVNCIINQTYTNWELIMCDDGSTDNTYQIALEISKNDDRIKVLKNKNNLKLASTLNRCLEFAKGEYIARMDGDDVCDLSRFRKEYDFLETHSEYALVSCNVDLYDDDGVYRILRYRQMPSAEHLAGGSQFCHAGVMMRKSALIDVGCYNTEKQYDRIEDYHLWVKFYIKGYKGYNLQEVLYSMYDDRKAFRRRNWENRVNESRLVSFICNSFNLPLKYRKYVVLPILKYFVPNSIYKYMHRNR